MTDVANEVSPLLLKALFLRQLQAKQFTQQGNVWAIRWISTDFVSWNLCFWHLNSWLVHGCSSGRSKWLKQELWDEDEIYPTLLWFRVEWYLISRIIKQNVLLCKNQWALKKKSLWNTACRSKEHLRSTLTIRRSLKASAAMALKFYYFLLLKCFLLKKIVKAKLYCLSHTFLTEHSSNSIIKKAQAIDVSLETQWCLKHRNVWDAVCWKHSINICIYERVKFVIFLTVVPCNIH